MSTQGDVIAVTPLTGLTRLQSPYGSAVGQKWQVQVLNLTPYTLSLNVSGSQQTLAAGLIHVYMGQGSIDVTATPIVPVGATGTGEILTVWAYGDDEIGGTYPVPSLINANNVTIVGGNVSVTGPVTVTNDQIVLANMQPIAALGSLACPIPAGSPPIHALSLYAMGLTKRTLVAVTGITTGTVFYARYLEADQLRLHGPPIIPVTSALESGYEVSVLAGDAITSVNLIGYTAAVPPLPTPQIPPVLVAYAGGSGSPLAILPAAPAGQSYVLESVDLSAPGAGQIELQGSTIETFVQINNGTQSIDLKRLVDLGAITCNFTTAGGANCALRYRLSNAPDGSDVDI